MRSAGVASVKALKAVFLHIPQYVHMCHILLNSETPEVLQLSMFQDGHILVSAKFFFCCHLFPLARLTQDQELWVFEEQGP